MNKRKIVMRAIISLLLVVIVMVGFVGTSTTAATPGSAGKWSFGVISDSQWTITDDGYNPNAVAANIIKQIDQQFIKDGVKLVVAVGDTVNYSTQVNIDTRALYAQDLYNAGIGFYPLRGNHEATTNLSYLDSGLEFRHDYPQIVPGPNAGVNNNTPADITTAIIPSTDLTNNPPATKTGSTFTVGTNFSEPTAVNQANNSQSYAFRYNTATFVLLDQFDAAGDYGPSTIPDQMDWINSTLSNRPANTQAFVFTHKNILGGNHKDNMFGTNYANDPGDGYGVNVAALSPSDQAGLAAKIAAENEFEASMQANKVPFVISGHDHHHYFSLVTSPDGQSQVHQLITQSDSSKFYTPGLPVSANDIPIQQDLGRIGYYIFTVDGPEVTIDYYADNSGAGWAPNGGTFHFVKASTITCSLNGKENIVAQGSTYAMTDNTNVAAKMGYGFKGTTMSILSGTNSSTAKTNYGKAESNDVTTGWMPAQPNLSSDILTLAGMSNLLGDQTATYTLSMSYDNGHSLHLGNGGFGIATQDANGQWVNAVNMNYGGMPNFIVGQWNSSYGLGTYGVDPSTKTAWAVINYNGNFAVANGIEPVPGHRN